MSASTPWRRYFLLILPHRWRLAGGGLLVLVTVLLSFPGPWILKLLIDQALPRHDLHQFAGLLVVFAMLFLLRARLILVRNRVLQFTAMRVVCDLRIRLFAHLQTLSLEYFDANQAGKISSRITQDTNEVYQLTNGVAIIKNADVSHEPTLVQFSNWSIAAAVVDIRR